MSIIDTSVYVAIVNRTEPGHQASLAWFKHMERTNSPITAPAIFLAEVGAALSRGLGNAEIGHQIVNQLLQRNLVEIVPVTTYLGQRAALIAANYKIRGCDAVYVALAEQLERPLVTLDRQQLERGSRVVTTMSPETAV